MEHQPALALARLGRDELLARFRAGAVDPVPAGRLAGRLILLPGTPLSAPIARLARTVWRGKRFDGSGGVVNLLTPLGLAAVRGSVAARPSRLDGRACLGIDYAGGALVARPVHDEIRRVAPGLWLGLIWFAGRLIGFFVLSEPTRA